MSYRGRGGRRRGGNGRNQSRGSGGRKKWRPGIFVNRRRPESHWIPLYDIWLNTKERAYSWFFGVPEGSSIRWNDKGQIVGHYSRAKRPWFSRRR